MNMISDQDYQNLVELAQRELNEKVSKEEARRRLIECGLLDENGHFVCPGVAAYFLPARPSTNDAACTA